MTVLERLFRDYKFELPSTTISSFEVNTATLENPLLTLEELLRKYEAQQSKVIHADIQAFVDRFYEEHGLRLRLEAEACQALVDLAKQSGKTIRSICEEKFGDFQHGLQIVARNTQLKEFTITRSFIEYPDQSLSQLVVESFEKKKAHSKN